MKEIKKYLPDDATFRFWVYKMTIKTFSVFNNVPIRQVKYPDAQNFALSFGVCERDFPKET